MLLFFCLESYFFCVFSVFLKNIFVFKNRLKYSAVLRFLLLNKKMFVYFVKKSLQNEIIDYLCDAIDDNCCLICSLKLLLYTLSAQPMAELYNAYRFLSGAEIG